MEHSVIIIIDNNNVCEVNDCDMLLLITHPGIFHADDVMSAALLEVLFDIPGCVVRMIGDDWDAVLNSVTFYGISIDKAISEGIVHKIGIIRFDIGYGDFDHHQLNIEYHFEGTPYASFGKLWRVFGPMKYSAKIVENVEKDLCIPIDSTDNGVTKNPLSSLISAFNPNWDELQDPGERDRLFQEAVDMAKCLLEKYFKRIDSLLRSETAARNAISENSSGFPEILVMDKFIPLGRILQEEYPEILLIIGPSARIAGEWNISAVKRDSVDSGNGILLPEEWLCLRPKECTFVRKDLTLATFSSKDAAIQAACSAVDEAGMLSYGVTMADLKCYPTLYKMVLDHRISATEAGKIITEKRDKKEA